LGKKVEAQGETIRLEEWHLDICACFMDEVEGWEESVVARRLFAIIIGEKRRKAGLA
jgi:serine/arginine repetitive matrix protein 2